MNWGQPTGAPFVLLFRQRAAGTGAAPLTGTSQGELSSFCFTLYKVFISTFKAPGRSSYLATLSACTVSVKAGQGDECWYFALLENSS